MHHLPSFETDQVEYWESMFPILLVSGPREAGNIKVLYVPPPMAVNAVKSEHRFARLPGPLPSTAGYGRFP